MTKELEEKIFTFGMYWRVVYGTLRVILGLAILKIVGAPVINVITSLMSHELVEDPNDLLYALAARVVPHELYISYFLAVYFIFWGLVDVLLSISLVKKKMWAFPVSFVLIGGFIVYELARFSYSHSLILLWIIIVDILILWLIKREYARIKPRLSA
ncbi:MAG: DUF2127 domain-containing protein [Minisyncoccia bacterium]